MKAMMKMLGVARQGEGVNQKDSEKVRRSDGQRKHTN